MNQTESNATQDDGWSNLPLYSLYILTGFPVAVGNLLIATAIARFEALRQSKEYVILFGLSFADCLSMAGFFFAGIYRISLLVSGTHNNTKTVWSCLLTIQNILWSVGMQLSSLMLTVVSTDRLLSVLYPLKYIGWTASYANKFVLSIYSFVFIQAVYYYMSAYGVADRVQATCVIVSCVRKVTHPLYYIYFNLAIPFYSALSVILYCIVMIVLRKRFNTLVFSEHPHQQYELKRQRKVTTTLLLSAVCTLFLFVLPFGSGLYLYANGSYSIAVFLWCICNLNPLANVILYPLRHDEVRQALVALIKRKQMPAHLKAWTNKGKEQNAQQQPRIKLVPRNATNVQVAPSLRAAELRSGSQFKSRSGVVFNVAEAHVIVL